ncbi:unnamed protein product [Brassica oleracea var. botrytis]
MVSHPFHDPKEVLDLTCRFGSSYSHNGFEIWLMLQVSREAFAYHVSSHRSLLSKEGRYSSIQGFSDFLIVFCLMLAGEGGVDLEEHSEWYGDSLTF